MLKKARDDLAALHHRELEDKERLKTEQKGRAEDCPLPGASCWQDICRDKAANMGSVRSESA